MTHTHSSSGNDVPLQAKAQQAIMAHPHFEGSATLAFGLAGAALKAMPTEPQTSGHSRFCAMHTIGECTCSMTRPQSKGDQ